MDLTTIRLRSTVEQDALDVLARLDRDKDAASAIGSTDVFALRQFLGWHRLRFGVPPEPPELAGRLAQFVDDFGRRERLEDADPPRSTIDQQLRAAGLRREQGLLSAVTLRRRIASVARIYEAAGAGRLQDDEQIARAIADVEASNRRERKFATLSAKAQARDRLLASGDGSPAGLRDRALMASWLASGESFSVLLRIDRDPLVAAVGQCADVHLRELALDALARWIAVSALSTGPLFRRVRGDGRMGAPMTRTTAQQVVRRWLARATPSGGNAAESNVPSGGRLTGMRPD